jgi:hypothetical protein
VARRAPVGILLVNTGSVGRPKDGDWRAGYVLQAIGMAAMSVEQARVENKVDWAAAAIRASTLPDDFAAYLETGGSRGELAAFDPGCLPRRRGSAGRGDAFSHNRRVLSETLAPGVVIWTTSAQGVPDPR